MPHPASVKQGSGEFLIDTHFAVTLDGFTGPRLLRARQRFLDILNRETGIPFGLEPSTPSHFQIHTDGPSAAIQKLGEDESYHLEVKPDAVHLTAANPLGAMHGLQT